MKSIYRYTVEEILCYRANVIYNTRELRGALIGISAWIIRTGLNL